MTIPALDGHFWSHYPSILRPLAPPTPSQPGLSGGVVWRAETNAGPVAIRRFAPHQHLPSTHAVHDHTTKARALGWIEIPQPLPNSHGGTLTDHGNHLWEITTWQPGEPAKFPIDDLRNGAAMRFIARWHSFWTRDKLGHNLQTASPDAVANRQAEWQRLTTGWHAQAASAGMSNSPEPSESCPRLQLGHATPNNDPLRLAGRTAQAVKARADRTEDHLHVLPPLLAREPKVYCHGDLHREHILFTDDDVTGFIDLSCRWDYAAADLARWLSTTTEPNRWAEAVAWYREVASLSPASERAIPLLAETGLVIAALRWKRWLLGPESERRFFPRPDLAYDRWRLIVERLEAAEL